MAVRQKVLGLGLPEMLRQAPFLYQQLNDGVRTELSLDELISLTTAAAGISSDGIRTEVLDQDYVMAYRTPEGASVLVPINEQITPLIQDLFFSQ
jgi:hypothetical protein